MQSVNADREPNEFLYHAVTLKGYYWNSVKAGKRCFDTLYSGRPRSGDERFHPRTYKAVCYKVGGTQLGLATTGDPTTLRQRWLLVVGWLVDNKTMEVIYPKLIMLRANPSSVVDARRLSIEEGLLHDDRRIRNLAIAIEKQQANVL